jgi:hypothetical protein
MHIRNPYCSVIHRITFDVTEDLPLNVRFINRKSGGIARFHTAGGVLSRLRHFVTILTPQTDAKTKGAPDVLKVLETPGKMVSRRGATKKRAVSDNFGLASANAAIILFSDE